MQENPMKVAVFQVNEQSAAYLVCVRMPGLRSASKLEERLRKRAAPEKEIKLLGRFDAVHAAPSQHAAESLILGQGQLIPDALRALEEHTADGHDAGGKNEE
jgi:hypothetical protein